MKNVHAFLKLTSAPLVDMFELFVLGMAHPCSQWFFHLGRWDSRDGAATAMGEPSTVCCLQVLQLSTWSDFSGTISKSEGGCWALKEGGIVMELDRRGEDSLNGVSSWQCVEGEVERMVPCIQHMSQHWEAHISASWADQSVWRTDTCSLCVSLRTDTVSVYTFNKPNAWKMWLLDFLNFRILFCPQQEKVISWNKFFLKKIQLLIFSPFLKLGLEE